MTMYLFIDCQKTNVATTNGWHGINKAQPCRVPTVSGIPAGFRLPMPPDVTFSDSQ